MQEYINGLVFINGKLNKKNFAIINGKILFDYVSENKAIDLSGKIVSHAFIDIHVHTRTPGFTHKEDVEHVTKAALSGGFTNIVAMANLDPEPYNVSTYMEVKKYVDESSINIIQSARATNNNAVVDYLALSKFTNIFTDDGSPIEDDELMNNVLLGVKKVGGVLMLHEEDHSMNGVAYTSDMTIKNNLPSLTSDYEWKIVERDIGLNKKINCRIHLQHISVKETLPLLKKAKNNGMNITAELTPHHLFFNNSMITNDGKYKMNPPIGSVEDQTALIQAFKTGLVDIIATDHAPHTFSEKEGGFLNAANGIIGLETAFAAINTIIGNEHIETILKSLTLNPAKLIGIDGDIVEGADANIVIIDPTLKWKVTEDDIKSKSCNSPFIGLEFTGKVIKVIYNKNTS